MKMDAYDTIVLTIHANNNEMVSKTTVQKLVYFHTVMIENIEIPGYTHYFYGPFNQDVSTALQEMSEFSYIDQSVISNYYETYRYRLTEDGVWYAEDAKKKHPDEFKTIYETVTTCRKHCSLKPLPLSYAAKAYYVLTSEKGVVGNYTVDDVKEAARDFDWEISTADTKTGIELLEKLRLVSIS